MKKIIVSILMFFVVSQLFCETYEEFTKLINGKTELEQIIWIEKQLKTEKDIRYYILKANIEIKLGDYRSAKNTLLAAKECGFNVDVEHLLGIVYFNLKQYDLASQVFTSLLENEANDNLSKTFLDMIEPLNKITVSVAKQSHSDVDDLTLIESVDFEQLNAMYNEEIGQVDDDFIYLLNECYVDVLDNAKYNYIAHYIIKVNTSNAVSIFKDFNYSYNGYEYSANVIKAGTYNDDGEFIAVDKKHIVDIDNQKKSTMSMYSNRKTIIFPLADLKEGSIIEVAIKFTSTGKTLAPKIYNDFTLYNNIRTMMYRYTVAYPKNAEIHFYKNGEGVVESVTESDNIITRKYIYNVNENNMSQDKIVVTGYSSWDEVATWYQEIFYQMLNKENPSLADEILSKLDIKNKSVKEQIDAVYKFIKKNIRYVGLELDENAMLPRSPSQIYKNKFGDCKDQAIFMIYLLQRLNIDCSIALLGTGDSQVDQNIASPLYFNHVITYLPKQNGLDEMFIDTTSFKIPFDNLPASDQDINSFVVAKDGSYQFITTPIIDGKKNRIEEYFIADVNQIGSGRVQYTEKFIGAYADIFSESVAGKNDEYIVNYLYNSQKETYHALDKQNIAVKGLNAESDEIEVNLFSDEKNVVSLFFDGKMKLNFSLGEVISSVGVPTDANQDYNRDFLSSYRRTVEYKFPPNYTITDGTVKNFYKQNEYISLEFIVDKKEPNSYIFDVEYIVKKRHIPQEFVLSTQKIIAEFIALSNFELTFENKVDFDNETFFEKLIEEYDYKDVYEKYITFLTSQGKFEKALDICDKASSKFNENSYFGLIKASLLFELERYEEDEVLLNDLLNVAISKNSTNDLHDIYYYLITLYKRTCDDAKFETALINALEAFPEDRGLIGEATSFYCRNAKYDNAVEVLNKAIVKDEKNSSYYSDLGYVYSMVPDFKNAEAALLNAIKYDKNNHNAMNNLAWLYCENKCNIEQALTYAKRAVELDPLNDSYLDTLAEVYFVSGDYKNAKDSIKKAMQINPNSYLQHQLEKVENAEKQATENKSEQQ